jgi:alpha-methylacyl-CoA racemase
LDGVRVVELAGIGPAPFAAMMLADAGADVIRVDRINRVSRGRVPGDAASDITGRGRRSVALDLKHPDSRAVLLTLAQRADILLEGNRPGVTERLGIGPEDCHAVNPALVYGRMTGWGQDGPYAPYAGHDINYIALAGALWPIGRVGEPPVPPLNLLGDYGGGAMYLAFGLVSALLEARTSGRGQVVDAAMVDGAASLTAMLWGMRASGAQSDARGVSLLDTGAPFYEVYECADGKYVSLGALEREFYAELCRLTGYDHAAAGGDARRSDPATWPAGKKAMAELIRTRTRDEWCALLEHTDACFAPVLDWSEAPRHPHNVARGTFVERDGITQPAPAPRFSRTLSEIRRRPPIPGEHTAEILGEAGLSAADIATLTAAGAARNASAPTETSC